MTDSFASWRPGQRTPLPTPPSAPHQQQPPSAQRRQHQHPQPAVDTSIVRGAFQIPPRVQLKYVDADALYVMWRWEHAVDEPRLHMLLSEQVRPLLDELEQAVPSPLPGESVSAALERAAAGPLGDPEREHRLLTELSRALLPYRFAVEINELLGRGIRPHVRVQASPSLGHVPWEALLVDEGHRMVDEVDVSMLPPASVRNAAGRPRSPYTAAGAVAAVIDPPVPGRALAPVLGPAAALAGSPIADRLTHLEGRLVVPRAAAGSPIGASVGRDELREMLADASRLIYVGHVSSADHGLDVRMHLSDPADAPGHADPAGQHRPLSAADIAFGHDSGGPWCIPARVALIACESGGDARFAEATGLVAAMVRRGADTVTAARWTLPTDAGFRAIGDPGRDRRAPQAVGAAGHAVTHGPGAASRPGAAPAPFSEAVAAIDLAHEAADPVAAMCAWQREQSAKWAETGLLEHSPLLWGAFTTAWAP